MKQSTAGAIIQQKKIRILCFDSIEPPCLSLLDSTFFSVVFWPFQGSNEQPGADTQDSWVSRDHSTPGFPSRASAILKIARRETLGTRLIDHEADLLKRRLQTIEIAGATTLKPKNHKTTKNQQHF